MLTTENQQKIITALLKRPENHLCADCNCKTPCWASLDFGVFVCMNCSGAHRALGPSITRVKSTKLDIWNKDWLDNMKIGNSILNQYWQHALSSHPTNLKPNVNSSLSDIKKFVYDKYVKKKYVDPDEELDPLSKVKKGLTIQKPQQDHIPTKPNSSSLNSTKPTIQTFKQTPKKHQHHTVKQSTLNFHKEDPFNNTKFQNNSQSQKVQDNLLDFNDGGNQKVFNNQTSQKKQFDFNFNEIQVQIPKKPENTDSKGNNTGFDSFLQNISNKSESSNGHIPHPQQAIHGNYFMSPQGFVNSHNPSHCQHHGYSLPSHHANQPQVTMNINMNMYPNVMNINMGTGPVYPGGVNMSQGLNHGGQNKQFEYNDFFTANISPPPAAQNITLEVTLDKNSGQKANKDNKSWVDDWM